MSDVRGKKSAGVHGLAGVGRACPVCGGPIAPGAPKAQRYCRSACRTKAYRDRPPTRPPIIYPDLYGPPMPWPPHEVPIAVVAHPQRRAQAEALAEEVYAEALLMDDAERPFGPFVNHLRAWSWLSGGNCPWSMVIEDDAVPLAVAPRGPQSFRWQLHAALRAARTPVVSFYLGRSRPPLWQSSIARAVGRTYLRDACFFTSSHLLHGVGYAIRTDLIPDMIQSIAPLQHTLGVDEAVSLWARARAHRVSYAWPSLLDHSDGPSLITDRPGDRTLPRRAWCVDSREVWGPTALPIPTPHLLREMLDD